jgi:fructose-bisphosphate aldolase class 1
VIKFKGRVEVLEQFVYDYLTPSQATRDHKTITKEIAEYVGRTYEQGVELQRIIMDGAIVPMVEPAELTTKEE